VCSAVVTACLEGVGELRSSVCSCQIDHMNLIAVIMLYHVVWHADTRRLLDVYVCV